MTNDEIADAVAARIDQSIRESVPREILISSMLVIQVISGFAFLFYGVRQGGWLPVAAGGFCELGIFWPINRLLEIRRENIRLKILPTLIRTVGKQDQKELMYEFVRELMRKL